MSERDLVLGIWEIVEMDAWDKRTLDLVGRAEVSFDADGMGSIRFIAVRGGIDYEVVMRSGNSTVEFCWEGTSEGDSISGRAWPALEGSTMRGRLYVFAGDSSSFVARRVAASRTPS